MPPFLWPWHLSSQSRGFRVCSFRLGFERSPCSVRLTFLLSSLLRSLYEPLCFALLLRRGEFLPADNITVLLGEGEFIRSPRTMCLPPNKMTWWDCRQRRIPPITIAFSFNPGWSPPPPARFFFFYDASRSWGNKGTARGWSASVTRQRWEKDYFSG